MERIRKSISKCKVWREYILIFLCVGSREYQFNRLLIEMDKLIRDKKITEQVFAQIGKSTYIPQNFEYLRFMDSNEFLSYQKNAELIISHGGTGALVNALKLQKQVIAVPRLSQYKEHIDDHQLQVSTELSKKGFLKCVTDIEELGIMIEELKRNPITKKFNSESNVVPIIIEYLEGV